MSEWFTRIVKPWNGESERKEGRKGTRGLQQLQRDEESPLAKRNTNFSRSSERRQPCLSTMVLRWRGSGKG